MNDRELAVWLPLLLFAGTQKGDTTMDEAYVSSFVYLVNPGGEPDHPSAQPCCAQPWLNLPQPAAVYQTATPLLVFPSAPAGEFAKLVGPAAAADAHCCRLPASAHAKHCELMAYPHRHPPLLPRHR